MSAISRATIQALVKVCEQLPDDVLVLILNTAISELKKVKKVNPDTDRAQDSKQAALQTTVNINSLPTKNFKRPKQVSHTKPVNPALVRGPKPTKKEVVSA